LQRLKEDKAALTLLYALQIPKKRICKRKTA